jgi:hypothetical protein
VLIYVATTKRLSASSKKKHITDKGTESQVATNIPPRNPPTPPYHVMTDIPY